MDTDFKHTVELYESEQHLLDSLEKYFSAGLRGNETCIVIATETHRNQLRDRLKALGINMDLAELTGQYIEQDAAITLSHFMEKGQLSPSAFSQIIGSMIPHIPTRPIRAYGEMVTLLWNQGNHAAALQLEELWNNLGRIRNFSLLCSYPKHELESSSQDDVSDVFRLHSASLAI
jgi:hypothetical protein